MSDPAYLEWPALRKRMWGKFTDEQTDGQLIATRAELLAVLAWTDKFNRDAQPRRDEEERIHGILRRAAALLETREPEQPQ